MRNQLLPISAAANDGTVAFIRSIPALVACPPCAGYGLRRRRVRRCAWPESSVCSWFSSPGGVRSSWARQSSRQPACLRRRRRSRLDRRWSALGTRPRSLKLSFAIQRLGGWLRYSSLLGYFGPTLILALLGISFVLPSSEDLMTRGVTLFVLVGGATPCRSARSDSNDRHAARTCAREASDRRRHNSRRG